MNIVEAILPIEQRRLKIMLIAMGINFSIFLLALILKDTRSFTDLGGGLALVNTPIMTWLIGESIRPTQSPNTTYTSSSTQVSTKTDNVQ
jgi:hypothetical protein